MINKLDVFFPNQPTNNTVFAAFMLWLSSAAKIAVKAAIMFHIGREHMVTAATQLVENPIQKLLPYLNDAPLAIKIERLLKGPKFSMMHPGSPSPPPSPFKKQRLNLNTPPSQQGGRGISPGEQGFTPRGRSFRGRGSGRGYQTRENFVVTPPNSASSVNAGHAMATSGHSPLKGKVLLWDDV